MINVSRLIDIRMGAKSAYSIVQQTRLEIMSLSRKAEITHQESPCGLLFWHELYTYIY